MHVDSELSDFEDLFFNAVRLAMIPLVEITVEGKHALVQKELKRAPHAGAPSLSLLQRLPPFMRKLDADPGFIKEMAEICLGIYHPKNSACALGVQGHPDIQKVFAASALHVADVGVIVDCSLPTMQFAKQDSGMT